MLHFLGIARPYFISIAAIASLACMNKSSSNLSLESFSKKVTLSEDKGGLISGAPWSSDSLKGKVHMLIYVDPDQSDLNNEFTEALKKETFSQKAFSSVAIINLAATWKPNAIIESILKSKQEEFPDTIYVTDRDKHLVKEWKLEDDSFDVLLFDHENRAIFRQHGKIDQATTQKIIDIIKSEIKTPGITIQNLNQNQDQSRC